MELKKLISLNYLPRKRFGYTFIEILIVVAIIGFLTTIGVASYNNFNEKRTVEKAANELISYFRLAASKANSNEKDCRADKCGDAEGKCDSGNDRVLNGWFIDLSVPQIYGECEGIKFSQEDFLTAIDNLTISPSPIIQFYPLGQGTNLSTDYLDITLTRLGNSVVLRIDKSGNVNIKP